MWLASVSIRNPRHGDIIATRNWNQAQMTRARRTLWWLLKGVGDMTRERNFRMNVTLCQHRGLSTTEEERVGLGCSIHLAGGPVEVYWSHGLGQEPTTQPCENPRHELLNPRRPDLWLPADCGECETCRARKLVERTGLHYNAALAAGYVP